MLKIYTAIQKRENSDRRGKAKNEGGRSKKVIIANKTDLRTNNKKQTKKMGDDKADDTRRVSAMTNKEVKTMFKRVMTLLIEDPYLRQREEQEKAKWAAR